MELWDAYDREGNKLGFDLVRDEIVPENVYHIVAEIFVFSTDGKVLITQRHPDKSWPLKWENTGGSILKGETAEQGAVRELYEETGIKITEADLCPVYAEVVHPAIYKCYGVFVDSSVEIRLQEGETVDYKWLPRAEFMEFIKNEDFVIKIGESIMRHIDKIQELQSSYDCRMSKENHEFRYRAAAIIIEDNCVLFAKNEKVDYYYSIGGAVKTGESGEEAVKREVLEETGVEYEVDRLAFVHENFFVENYRGVPKKWHEVALYFLMKPRGTQELNSISYSQGVREQMHWLPIDRLSEYKAYPEFFKNRLSDIKPYIEHIVSHELPE